MNQSTHSNVTQSPTPFAGPHSNPDHAPAPDAAEPQGAGSRGRPSLYSDKVLAMLKQAIRLHGYSDSAAAKSLGMGASTISRWKRERPELAHELQQARHECRTYYLQIVERHAEAENNRGLRAAMWMLERTFPGDYAPKIKERWAHRTFVEQENEGAFRECINEDVRERLAARDAWEAAEEARQAAATAESEMHAASEGDCHNCRNSEAAAEPAGSEGDSDGGTLAAHRAVATTGVRGEHECFLSEDDCQNCRNAKATTEPAGSDGSAQTAHRGCNQTLDRASDAQGGSLLPVDRPGEGGRGAGDRD